MGQTSHSFTLRCQMYLCRLAWDCPMPRPGSRGPRCPPSAVSNISKTFLQSILMIKAPPQNKDRAFLTSLISWLPLGDKAYGSAIGTASARILGCPAAPPTKPAAPMRTWSRRGSPAAPQRWPT